MNRFTYWDVILDTRDGLKQWRIWSALSWNIIKMQYRRTLIGPLWVTLQHTIFVIALGYMFATIQKENFSLFFVYFATGYTFWLLIASFVTEAGNTFMGINGLPNMTRAALSNHIYLQFTSQMLLFAHRVIPLIVIFFVFNRSLSINLPLFLCGFCLLLVFGFWISTLLGCLSLRFQDLMPAVTSLMQIMFFVTPVMYQKSMIPGGEHLSNFNPFYHILVVVRGNLVQENVTLYNWLALVLINIIGIAVTLWVLRRSRPKLAYWA
ncbi:MAG: ABC transporter permease [Deltaproteobacteria bacterium]|nr:ABC transporter permease [Deltaproteobacteria bacterium]